jgi:hypothetical protein
VGNNQIKVFYKCIKLFNKTSWVCKGCGPSKRPVSEAKLNEVRTSLFHSQSKKIKNTSCPTSKQHNRQCTRLCAHSWDLKVTEPNFETCNSRRRSSHILLWCFIKTPRWRWTLTQSKIVFNEEANPNCPGIFTRRNVTMRGTNNLHQLWQLQRHYNVFCADLSKLVFVRAFLFVPNATRTV